jgi:isopenicillin-N epimerase
MRSHFTARTPAPPPPIRENIRSLWMLDDQVDFLNHGSFGARLRAVHEAQIRWRERMEARPVEFLDRRLPELLSEAKDTVGGFLGMQRDDFGFTNNATDGVNAVLRSLRFEPGDELLTTNHVYEAVRRAMRHLAGRSGATVIEVDIPLPLCDPASIVDAIDGAITDRTRLLVIDHITSPTAVLFPVEAIIKRCAARGVDVLVDGAHAPGMIELDVERLGAACYAGNLHKWICAPPGAGFLWVRKDRQRDVHPTVLSLRQGDGFANEFSWQGTRDVSSWLAVPDAIRGMDNLNGPGSWPQVMRHNHELAVWVQGMLGEVWGVQPLTPPNGSMLGSMVSLDAPAAARRRFQTREALQARLYADYRIEVFVLEWQGRWLVRPCCQVYNTPEQYRRLASAVLELTA